MTQSPAAQVSRGRYPVEAVDRIADCCCATSEVRAALAEQHGGTVVRIATSAERQSLPDQVAGALALTWSGRF